MARILDKLKNLLLRKGNEETAAEQKAPLGNEEKILHVVAEEVTRPENAEVSGKQPSGHVAFNAVTHMFFTNSTALYSRKGTQKIINPEFTDLIKESQDNGFNFCVITIAHDHESQRKNLISQCETSEQAAIISKIPFISEDKALETLNAAYKHLKEVKGDNSRPAVLYIGTGLTEVPKQYEHLQDKFTIIQPPMGFLNNTESVKNEMAKTRAAFSAYTAQSQERNAKILSNQPDTSFTQGQKQLGGGKDNEGRTGGAGS